MRNLKTLVLILGLGVIAPALGGCVVHGRGHVHAAYVVDTSPPPPRVVHVQARPGWVYVQGYWYWSGNDWLWTDGYWEQERAGHVWVQGTWVAHGGRHHWKPGHWKKGHHHHQPTVIVREHGGGDKVVKVKVRDHDKGKVKVKKVKVREHD